MKTEVDERTAEDVLRALRDQADGSQKQRARVRERRGLRQQKRAEVNAQVESLNRSFSERDAARLTALLQEDFALERLERADADLERSLEDFERALSRKMQVAQNKINLAASHQLADEAKNVSHEIDQLATQLVAQMREKLSDLDRLALQQGAFRQPFGLPHLPSLRERFAAEISELGRLLGVIVEAGLRDWTTVKIDETGIPLPTP